MNEEEKEAIKVIKHSLELEKQLRNGYKWKTGFYENLSIEKLLNLVDKQQKEIERLKDEYLRKVFELQRFIQEVEVADQECISKDKIKEKIKEVENREENYTFDKLTSEDIRRTIITNLKDLLGE